MAVLLAAALLLTAACGENGGTASPGTASGEDSPETVGMGRYLEEELSFPEAFGVVAMGQDKEGVLRVFARTSQDAPVLWRSVDAGSTWEVQELSWPEFLTGTDGMSSVRTASFLEDGSILVLYETETAEDAPPYHLVKIDGTGQAVPMPIAPTPADSGIGVNSLYLTESGDLLSSHYFDLVQHDGESGKIKFTYDPQTSVTEGTYTVLGNLLAMDAGKSIQLYDLKTGEQTSEISCIQNSKNISVAGSAERILTVDKEENTLYFCDQTGLYRTIIGGTAQERLIDGSLTSLGKPSILLQKLLIMPDRRVLVLCFEEGAGFYLLRYQYHPDVPSLPSTELRVYSLKDSKTMRQAMSLYQRDNPEIRFVYEIGISGSATDSDGVSMGSGSASLESDALRTLSTELLASKGPDILLLDGLPAESYIAKGALADLSDVAESMAAELFPNVAESYRREGKLYGVPARFTVPMIFGEDAAVSAADDAEKLADWLEAHPESMLENTLPETLLRLYYPVYASKLFQESGEADEKAVKEFLSVLRRLTQVPGLMNRGFNGDGQDVQTETDLIVDAILWGDGVINLSIGNFDGFEIMRPLGSALEKRENGNFRPLDGGNGPVFLPRTVLALNAAGKQQEASKEFLKFALSEEALSADFVEGMPINQGAFFQNTKNPDPEDPQGYYSVAGTYENGESYVAELFTRWPKEAQIKKLTDQIMSVKTAAPVDRVVLQIFLDETESYLNGDGTLEEAAAALCKKLSLYLGE